MTYLHYLFNDRKWKTKYITMSKTNDRHIQLVTWIPQLRAVRMTNLQMSSNSTS